MFERYSMLFTFCIFEIYKHKLAYIGIFYIICVYIDSIKNNSCIH